MNERENTHHTEELKRRHQQLTELDQLKREMRCFCRGLIPFAVQQLLVAWFMEDDAAAARRLRDNRLGIVTRQLYHEEENASEIIFEEIQQLRRKFERQEPLVQLELILWKNACLVNIPDETIQSSPFNYLLRGGWKENKRVNRHHAMIGTVIHNVLRFLPYGYFTQDVVKSVTVSNAGFEQVNGKYTKSWNEIGTFIKPGVYEGDTVTYTIQNNDVETQVFAPSNWRFSFDEHKNNDGAEQAVRDAFSFYFAQISSELEERAPPRSGWDVRDRGREPAPFVCAEIVPQYKMPFTYSENMYYPWMAEEEMGEEDKEYYNGLH